ncbi:MFS transporter [Streptomyces desertarenae]|uniref:MFS transporter n=1 Tax=Streptomyces desertarenae TaxID=2666184 RepID=A0ABW4PIP1_9ACTN
MSQVLAAPVLEESQTRHRPSVMVAVLAFAGIVIASMQTLVIPVIPELPRLLDASPGDTAWTVTATLLAATIVTPIVGRLADMYGKRKMLIGSLVLMVVGSVIAALATSLAPLIVARVLQGLASGVIPLGISIMRDELPRERLGAATATMSSSLGVGAAFGMPAAALIADKADWHVLFWTSAVLGVVALALVAVFVPASKIRTGGKFDLVGATGLSAALVCLLLAISKGSDWGWSSALVLGLFAAAAVLLVAWGAFELRTGTPMIDLRTAARKPVLLTNLAAAAFGFAMFSIQLALPQLLQTPEATGYGLGKSMLVAGLAMAPQGLVMFFVAKPSAKISAAFGAKVTLMLGAVTVAAGYVIGVFLMAEIWQLVLVSCIIGAGIGMAYGAIPTLIMSNVPSSETAAANSLNVLIRGFGTTIASAVAGLILAGVTMTFGGHQLPSQDAFRIILAIGAVAALVAMTLAAFLPRQKIGAHTHH